MSFIAMALIVVGYGLLYTGMMDFSGNNIGLFQAFGYTGTKGPSVDSSQYTVSNPVANMTSQPAVYSVNNGLTGSVSV
jgi:hypothetical protein